MEHEDGDEKKVDVEAKAEKAKAEKAKAEKAKAEKAKLARFEELMKLATFRLAIMACAGLDWTLGPLWHVSTSSYMELPPNRLAIMACAGLGRWRIGWAPLLLKQRSSKVFLFIAKEVSLSPPLPSRTALCPPRSDRCISAIASRRARACVRARVVFPLLPLHYLSCASHVVRSAAGAWGCR